MKDKWRNLIKFQHLRKDEAAKVPYKSAVRAANAAGKGGGGGKTTANRASGKGATSAKTGAKGSTKQTKTGAGKKGAAASTSAAGKKTTTVSRDALKKGDGGAKASATTMTAKEKLKAKYGRGHADDEDDDHEYEILDANANAASKVEDAIVAKLKEKRAGMVNEVEHAESELARMKTVVEDAEAVYSSARARVHEALMGEDGEEEDDDEGGSFPADDVDWDKYLHFGEHEEDEEDENVARAAEAAALAHEAVKTGQKRPSGEKRPSEKKPKTEADDDAEDGDATDREAESDEDVEEDPDSEDDDELDDEERAAKIANQVLADAGLPPMHEIEHILLAELKKLEAANATVVHARLALEAVDAEFAEALVNAHNAKTKETFAEDDDDLGKDFNMEDDEEIDSDEADGVDEDEEIDSDEAEGDGGDDDEPAPPKNNKARAKAKSTAQNDSADAGGGSRVVEDRRFGIYDARRYRSEAENDAEAAAQAAKGGGKAASGAKRKAPSGGGGNKKTAKTASDANHEIWYEKTSGAKASKARAPAKKAASRASAAPAAPGSMPSWRRKRAATRVTIGRPVAGPTSWAAIGQHIINE